MNDEQQVQQVGRWLGWSAVLLLLLAVLGISLISMGVFDPPLAGDEESVMPLDRQLTVSTEQIEWLDMAVEGEAVTVWLAAAYTQGEQDSSYGLALGSPDDYLVVAVSPAGYVTVFQVNSEQLAVTSEQLAVNSEQFTLANDPFAVHHSPFTVHHSPLLPWQPWPHVWRGQQSNEFLLEIVGDDVTARVNREWLWQGKWEGRGRAPALYLATHNQPVTVSFQQITVRQ